LFEEKHRGLGNVDMVCDDSGNLYVSMGMVDEDVYFVASHDYGQTWGPLTWLDDMYSSGGNVTELSVICDNSGHVYVMWCEVEMVEEYGFLFRYSNDYGVTWSEVVIFEAGYGNEEYRAFDQMVCYDTGMLLAIWHNSNGVFLRRCLDYGSNWQEEVMIYSFEGIVYDKRIALGPSGYIYLVGAQDIGSGYDISFMYSSDYGQTWHEETKIDVDDPVTIRSFEPKIAADNNGNVYVAWSDTNGINTGPRLNDFNYKVHFNYSSDHDRTWQDEDMVITLAGDFQDSYSLSCSDFGGVYLSSMYYGGDCEYISAEEQSLLFNYSLDYGRTWCDEDVLVTSYVLDAGYIRSPPMTSDSHGHVYIGSKEEVWIEDTSYEYIKNSYIYILALPDSTLLNR